MAATHISQHLRGPGRVPGAHHSHHAVLRMAASRLALAAKVVVIADETLVAVAHYRFLASVARHVGVQFPFSALTPTTFALLGANRQPVDRARHLGQGNHQLVVAANCHIIAVLVLPGDVDGVATQLREDGAQFLHQVGEGAANVTLHSKAAHFPTSGVRVIAACVVRFVVDLEGNNVLGRHFHVLLLVIRNLQSHCSSVQSR